MKKNKKKKTKKYVPKKSKNVGIILAALFGALAWIYTWKYDWHKLVIGFISIIIINVAMPIFAGFFGLCIYLWAFIDIVVKDKRLFEDYYK